MAVQNSNKLNQLSRLLPEGLLVDSAWMEEKGYSRSLRKQYVDAGWLYQPTRSVYRRSQGPLDWEMVVLSLQALLKLPVSIGGRTALEQLGFAHYLHQSHRVIHLYSDKKLPKWLFALKLDETFSKHNRHRFLPEVDMKSGIYSFGEIDVSFQKELENKGIQIVLNSEWKGPLIMSRPERAILELIDELPDEESFHHVDVTMEGLVNISPKIMQGLLEQTSSVKVKRLFLFFADRHQHSWLKHIDKEKITLGKGKRMLVKGGKLDSKYNITVPVDL